MPYLGSAPQATAATFAGVYSQSFNGNGSTTTFTLGRYVAQAANIEVIVNNVQQSPFDGSYSLTGGTSLVFSEAPSSGTNNIYVVYRDYPVQSLTDTGAVRKSGDTMTGLLINNVGFAADTDVSSAPDSKAYFQKRSSGAYVSGYQTIIETGSAGSRLERLKVDFDGRVTTPSQPSFVLYSSSGETTYTSTNQVLLAFNTAANNTGNHMNVGTGTFTAPVAGRYLFQASTWHNQSITSQSAIGFFVNGTQWDESRTPSVSGRYHKNVLVSIIPLSANDTVQLRTTSFNEHTMVAASIYTKYSGYFLG